MKHIRKINESDRAKLPMRKCLDVQWGTPKMPEDVKNYFFDRYECGNDVWVEHTIGQRNILDTWLLENCDVSVGERILLKHWW